jgi:hypothetical protein
MQTPRTIFSKTRPQRWRVNFATALAAQPNRPMRGNSNLIRLFLFGPEVRLEDIAADSSNAVSGSYAAHGYVSVGPGGNRWHLQPRAIYDCCCTASRYLENDWPVEPLRELYRRDREQWSDDFALLHEATLDHVLRKLQIIFPTLVRKALKLVSETQAHYWKEKDPVFYSLCRSGDVETSLVRFEQQCGTAGSG